MNQINLGLNQIIILFKTDIEDYFSFLHPANFKKQSIFL